MKFDFTREEFECLIEKCMLNEELKAILEMKIKGDSITKMAFELKMSESSVNRRINKLKKKIMRVIWHFLDKYLRESSIFFMP